MTWALVVVSCLLVIMVMAVLTSRSAWREQAIEARNIVAMYHAGQDPGARVAVFCGKWDLVVSSDGVIEKKEYK